MPVGRVASASVVLVPGWGVDEAVEMTNRSRRAGKARENRGRQV